MSFNRWFTLPILTGGGLIALLVAVTEVLQRSAPIWLIYAAAFPIVLLAAIFHQRSAVFSIWAAFALVYTVLDFRIDGTLLLVEPDTVQWAGLLAAGMIVNFISSERSRAMEISDRRIRELEAMTEISREISSELELNSLLQKIVSRAVKTLDATLGELLLFHMETGDMEVVAQFPVLTAQIGLTMKPGEGAMGRVAATRKPLIMNDYRAVVDSTTGESTTSIEALMGVPLLKGDEFIGVLGISRYRKNHKFTQSDLSLLNVLASQATIAIQNARLYQEVQHLAFTDSLTGLHNRRRLFELAEREYRRAVRYHRPLSILLMDIDHFKVINDRYGHAVGDEVLRWLAGECSATIRQKIDIIGRFGGEEFTVLYPETGLDSAIEASVRIQNRLKDGKVNIGDGSGIHITMSMGIASLPPDEAITLDQLIDRADKALYFAKEQRNSIAYWDCKQSMSFRIE